LFPAVFNPPLKLQELYHDRTHRFAPISKDLGWFGWKVIPFLFLRIRTLGNKGMGRLDQPQVAAFRKKCSRRLSFGGRKTERRMCQEIAHHQSRPHVLDLVAPRVMQPLGEVLTIPRVSRVETADEEMTVLRAEDRNMLRALQS
jgi:hypothetical protein